MEDLFKAIAVRLALGVELIAAILIAYGALEAIISEEELYASQDK